MAKTEVMRKSVKPRHRAKGAADVLRGIFGTHRIAALWVILVLISLSWFATGIQRLWNEWPEPTWLLMLIDILPGVILIGGLFWFARRAPHAPRPRIRKNDHPAPVLALIVFLSTRPRVSEGQADPLEQEGRLLDGEFLNRLGGIAWRMPLQAIAYHADLERKSYSGHLKHVVVIPSCDRCSDEGKLGGGTSKFEIVSLHTLLARCDMARRVQQDYSQGVDFESPEELEEAVFNAYEALHSMSIDDTDILVDVTGGQKPTSIAGAVVALSRDRRIQYVSMHDYRVRAYDVTFED